MTSRKIILLSICTVAIGLLSACTQTRYAAHVVKQIPVPGERAKSVGYFKVGAPYTIKGGRYKPFETYEFVQEGMASWYGPGFHGKLTANGETFDKNELTAAHKTLQLPSIIRVTNLDNGRSIILRVNDRGPYAHDRILDVSERGASLLGFKNAGVARIRMEVMGNESKQVAEMAKQKIDTRGFEVALNNKANRTNRAPAMPQVKPEPVSQVAMSNVNTPAPRAPYGQQVPMRKPAPVQSETLPSTAINNSSTNDYVTGSNVSNLSTGKIYVQAGSFSQEQNALNYSSRLSGYGQSKVYLTRINDRSYFRVRLGPYSNRMEAQQILTTLNQSGNNNAVIVVD